MRRIAAAAFAAALALSLASCSTSSGAGTVVWTDVPELALAVELYDSLPAPRGGRVELYWKSDLPDALSSAKALPALAVGRYLGCSRVRDSFAPIDYLLGAHGVNRGSFYPELLAAGIVGGRRILLPVSFNLPIIVFARDSSAPGDGFTLSLADIAASSAAFDRRNEGAYSRMGFSPRWYGRFLVAALEAGGAGFSEGKDLRWSETGLASALDEIVDWSTRANGSTALEDDYKFKYLFAPPYRHLKEGRALYAAMDSSDFFLAPDERRADLDFRWFAREGRVPVSDGVVWAGLLRRAPGRAGAEAFLRWLLGSEAQRAVIERSRRVRAASFSFGIAAGLSSIRAVNEEVLPAYYPALVGHAPPAALLVAPPTLPGDWPALEASVIESWAIEATASGSTGAAGHADELKELGARVADFRKRASRP